MIVSLLLSSFGLTTVIMTLTWIMAFEPKVPAVNMPLLYGSTCYVHQGTCQFATVINLSGKDSYDEGHITTEGKHSTIDNMFQNLWFSEDIFEFWYQKSSRVKWSVLGRDWTTWLWWAQQWQCLQPVKLTEFVVLLVETIRKGERNVRIRKGAVQFQLSQNWRIFHLTATTEELCSNLIALVETTNMNI